MEAQLLSKVSADTSPRLVLSSREVNRVLGGGLVPGSLVLLAGDPGIGKSTLLLRLAAGVSETGGKALYVSGEESAVQVKMRADRLGISGENLYVLPATALEEVLDSLERHRPTVAVVDSIQAVSDGNVGSEAGSLAQIKGCARALMEWTKAGQTATILSGHVTKGGEIAGPRVLEHMVDVVLQMEGDPISAWRLLRAGKNRFGSTNETGVFEMGGRGLEDVPDPSRAFLAERRDGAVGSVVVSTLEGSRPMLVEVQALVSPSALPAPRRVAAGIDSGRLLLICAVLTRHVGLPLSNQDIVVNVTGGLRVGEPAVDLGVALAIASSARGAPVEPGIAAIGEIGLTGEVRGVPQIDRRLLEASRLGLRRCIVPGGANGGPHNPGEDPGAPGAHRRGGGLGGPSARAASRRILLDTDGNTMRSAYFNCIGGASGDMVLGAVVDAGAPFDRLTAALDDLGVGGFSLSRRPGPSRRGARRLRRRRDGRGRQETQGLAGVRPRHREFAAGR